MFALRPARLTAVVGTIALLWAVGIGLASSHDQARSDEESRFQLRADIAARFTTTWVSQLLAHERTVATEELSEKTPNPEAFKALNESFGFQAAVILDNLGEVLEVSPDRGDLIGHTIAPQYPHLASAEAGRPAVSDLAMSAAQGLPVVAFATPYDTSYGLRVYSGDYQLGSTPLADYIANAIPLQGHRAYLIDANGVVLASSLSLPDSSVHKLTSVDAPLAATLARGGIQGRFGDTGGEWYFSTQSVAGTPWRIAVSVPASTLYSPVTGPTFWATWALFALFCIGVAAGLLLLFRYIDRRRDLAALNAELERVSRLDSLTGVHNRRHLDEQLAAMLSGGRRHREPVAVLLMDIDDFKSINDGAGGHAAGDSVLQQVAARLRRDARAEDVVGRWGGDEFMILMPRTDVAAARSMGERLLHDMSSEPLDVGGSSLTVSVSAGAAAGIDYSPEALQHRADIALYEAKRAGRARVVTVADAQAAVPAEAGVEHASARG